VINIKIIKNLSSIRARVFAEKTKEVVRKALKLWDKVFFGFPCK